MPSSFAIDRMTVYGESVAKDARKNYSVGGMVWILPGGRKGKPGGYSPGSSVGATANISMSDQRYFNVVDQRKKRLFDVENETKPNVGFSTLDNEDTTLESNVEKTLLKLHQNQSGY